jgi:hypothetical protein
VEGGATQAEADQTNSKFAARTGCRHEYNLKRTDAVKYRFSSPRKRLSFARLVLRPREPIDACSDDSRLAHADLPGWLRRRGARQPEAIPAACAGATARRTIESAASAWIRLYASLCSDCGDAGSSRFRGAGEPATKKRTSAASVCRHDGAHAA